MLSESKISELITSDHIKSFQDDGFMIIEKFWPESLILDFEKMIISFYYQTALKISKLKKHFHNSTDPTSFQRIEDLDEVLRLLETEDKEAAYQTLSLIENSVASKNIQTHEKFLEICSLLLNCPNQLFSFSGPNPFINIPTSKRLLYQWHSEANYYPKRRNFLNIWFPLFRNKNSENGTMYFCKGSHKNKNLNFIEYTGYDEDTHGKKNHFMQLEIPESELSNYERIAVNANRKDLVIFNKNLVHTSTLNTSQDITYASVMRVLDTRNDLTFSGNMGIKHYQENSDGRPGMEPILKL
jgi:ectoine hydroxylase-related dioxygenase (phytanoyl-CoA dioxygenase family)